MKYKIQFYSFTGFAFILRKETLIFFCNAYDVLKICFSFQDEISISLKDISKADSDYPDGF